MAVYAVILCGRGLENGDLVLQKSIQYIHYQVQQITCDSCTTVYLFFAKHVFFCLTRGSVIDQ